METLGYSVLQPKVIVSNSSYIACQTSEDLLEAFKIFLAVAKSTQIPNTKIF